MTTIEIKLNKKRLVPLFLSSIAFVGIGFWIVVSPFVMEDLFAGSSAVLVASGVVSILLFGVSTFLIGRKIANKGAGLLINSEGITDNSSDTSIGFIAWKDISAITSKVINTQTFVTIVVNNPQDYIDRAGSKIKKKIYQSTYKTHGTPIIISTVALAIKPAELVKLLQDSLWGYEELYQKRST